MIKHNRAEDLKPFIAMDVLEEALKMQRAGESVIHLELGEPDFNTPQCVIDAVKEALDRGMTHYTSTMGMLELREAIAADYHEDYGVTVSPEQIVVTEGTSPALLLIFAALLEKGDRVLLSDPYYACYPNYVNFFGGKTDFFKVREKEGFLYDMDVIRRKMTPKTKAILINSPSNPTGKVQSPEVLKAISELGSYIISDEIYHGLTYGVQAHSILEYTDKAFVLNGFSKRYAMTGWRLGYAIMPMEFVSAIRKLQQNFFICANSFVQYAGLIALQQSKADTETMRQEYSRRREYIVPALRNAGFKIKYEPDGAYYVLANIKQYSSDSLSFSQRILQEAKVAVTPGIDFGPSVNEYIRISYANSMENLQEGVLRLTRFIQSLQ